MITAGLFGGLITGAMPGLTATMAVALLVPFTFTMNPTEGLIVLGAIYMSCIYGGSFSAILVNTPGTPSSIGTTFDGYPMAKKGEGERALLIATFASVIGTIVGILAWVSLLNVLGFVVSSVVFLTALTLIIDTHTITFNRAVFTLAIYSMVVMAVWAFFHMVLMVPLPVDYLM